MNRWTLAGALGTLVVAATVAVGIRALVVNYALEDPGSLLVPTGAAFVVAGAFAFGLFVLGARSDRWLRNPYW